MLHFLRTAAAHCARTIAATAPPRRASAFVAPPPRLTALKRDSEGTGSHPNMPHSTPKQFLLDVPRGAYTAMHVRDGRYVLDWPMHLQRLVRSLAALNTAVSGFYAAYYAWLEEVGLQAYRRKRLAACRAAATTDRHRRRCACRTAALGLPSPKPCSACWPPPSRRRWGRLAMLPKAYLCHRRCSGSMSCSSSSCHLRPISPAAWT